LEHSPTPLRFLLDENFQRSVANWLAARGHEVHESREVVGPEAKDPVLNWLASTEGLVIVTYDEDFRYAVRRIAPVGTKAKVWKYASVLWVGVPAPRAQKRLGECIELVEHLFLYAREMTVRVERCEVQAERVVVRFMVPPQVAGPTQTGAE